MAVVEETRITGEFAYTWYIQNFSRCRSKDNESLISPCFYAEGIKWHLVLHPKGEYSPGFASLYLRPVKYDDYPANNTIMYKLSIRKQNGLFYNDSNTLTVSRITHNSCKCFVSLCQLNEPNTFLDKDILTIRCRLWRRATNSTESLNCSALTKIKVAKLNYLWTINDLVSGGTLKHTFRCNTRILYFSNVFPSLIIHLFTGDTFGDDAIYFAIESYGDASCEPLRTVCFQIQLLDSDGCETHSTSGEDIFLSVSETRRFQFISKRKMLTNIDSYIPGGKLTLKCEFSFSGDLEVEKVEYNFPNEQGFNFDELKLDLASEGHELWKENLLQFFSDGEFSDLIVRTPNREFLAHKAILCAQSEVFRGMLTHDMKEKNSGVFEINDFDDSTIFNLLLYLYTNTLANEIDFSSVKDLYFVADKYRIISLQKICSDHLINIMDTSIVCDILLIADQLRNQQLKLIARDLIVKNPHEVMNSVGWKNLKQNNFELFADTTEWIILNKLA